MKRLVYGILAALMICGAVMLHAPQAQAAYTNHNLTHCVCEESDVVVQGHVCEEATWLPFSQHMDALEDGGHYYLDTGITSKAVTISKDIEVSLCLNGNIMQAQKLFTLSGGATLNICDCRGGGALRSTKGDHGGYVIKIGTNGTVNLFSGIVEGTTTQKESAAVTPPEVPTVTPPMKLPADPSQTVTLKYDDRKVLATASGATPTQVSVTNEVPTSKKVGTNTTDTNVLKYENGVLYAVGTGTAKLNVDGTVYNVTVEKAKISLFMITGTSIGQGSYGDATKSVAIEAGQSYSTYVALSQNTTAEADRFTGAINENGGLGIGAATRAGTTLDAFAPGQGGNQGEGSAIAWQWNQLTGEKVWVLNASRAASSLNRWKAGGDHHENAIALFTDAQAVIQAEIAAGHFTMGEMAVIYHNGLNFGATNDLAAGTYTQADLKSWYDGMMASYRQSFNKDMDGDGVAETIKLTFSNGVAANWIESMTYKHQHDKAMAFYLAATDPDMAMASDAIYGWDQDLSTFPAIEYSTQSVAVTMPDSMYHANNGGTSTNSVYCSNDNCHLTQVGYNALGIDTANNLFAFLRGDRTITAVRIQQEDRSQPSTVRLSLNDTWLFAPLCTPIYGSGLTFETTGAVTQVAGTPWLIQGTQEGTGKLIAKRGSTVLAEVTFNVVDGHVHCWCEGAETVPAGHTCNEFTAWEAIASNAVNPYTMTDGGHYYLDWSGNTAKALKVANGATAYLCLNGASIRAQTTLTIGSGAHLIVCDCSSSQSGTITTTRYSPVTLGANTSLTLCSGTITGTYLAQASRISVKVTGGNFTMYGGSVTGGCKSVSTVTTGYVDTNPNGANIQAESGNVAIYGGTVSGGVTSANGKDIYIGGTATITVGGTAKITDLFLNTGKLVTVSAQRPLATGAAIGVTLAGTTGDVATGISTDCSGFFSSNVDGYKVSYDHAGSKLAVTAVVAARSLSLRSSSPVMLASATAEEPSYFRTTPVLIRGGMLNMYGGTIQNGKADHADTIYVDNAAFVGHGGNVIVYNNGAAVGNFNMYGGTITGGEATKSGGNVYVYGGRFTMTGGTITGGSAENGGNLSVTSDSSNVGRIDLNGGTVENGVAATSGGNVYALGDNGKRVDVYLNGGTITGGSADKGGNISQNKGTNGAMVYLNSGTVSNGTAENGGNLHAGSGSGYLYLQGACVTGGQATSGGNAYFGTNLTLRSGTITGGSATSAGGNIYINGGALALEGSASVTDGYSQSNAGNVQIYSGKFEMTGGIISGGEAKNGQGGNLYLRDLDNAQISGGTISGGTAKSKGGSIYVSTLAKLTVTNATIQGGVITGTDDNAVGGNIYNTGELVLGSGAKILDGYAHKGGNMLVASESKSTTIQAGAQIVGGECHTHGGNMLVYGNVDMTGGEIRDGVAHGGGGNVYIFNTNTSKFTMTGGIVSGGTAMDDHDKTDWLKGGGNFYVGGNAAQTPADNGIAYLIVGPDAQIVGGTATKWRGGNIAVVNGGNAVLDGCTVTGGTAAEGGPNVYLAIEERKASNGDYFYRGYPELTLKGEIATTLLVCNNTHENEGTTYYPVARAEQLGENAHISLDMVYPLLEQAYMTTDADYTGIIVSGKDGYEAIYNGETVSLSAVAEGTVAQVYSGSNKIADCRSFADAVKLCQKAGTFVKLMANVDAKDMSVDTLAVDLNGFNLKNLTVTGTLYGLDSTTDRYDGSRVGTLSNVTGTVATHWKASTAQIGAIKRYLTVEEDGSYTFHRFYVGITTMSLVPATVGVGYTAVFAGDAAVKAQLADAEAFGFEVWIDGYSPVAKTQTAQEFSIGTNSRTLHVQNFMKTENTLEQNMANAATEVKGKAFISFKNIGMVDSADYAYVLETMVEKADKQYDGYNAAQQEALQLMQKNYSDVMDGWTIPNIVHNNKETPWQPWDGTSVEGRFYMTQDVQLTASLTIPAGSQLELDLNGHKLTGATQLLNISGKLTLCDSYKNEAKDKQGVVSSSGTAKAPVFTVASGGEFNLKSGNLTATKQVTTAIGIGEIRGTMNMSGGSIYGGNAKNNAGGLSVQGGSFYMSGGEIRDCVSTGRGGNLDLFSGTAQITGGKITGGKAAYGGNVCALKDITISNCTISGGEAVGVPTLSLPYNGHGGNILAVGSRISITDCTVTDGVAEHNGGNIAIKNSAGAAMSATVSGSVLGGKAGNDGVNLYVYNPMESYADNTPIMLTLSGTFAEGMTTGVSTGIGSGKGRDIYLTRCDVTVKGKLTAGEMYLAAAQTLNVADMDVTSKIDKVVMDRDGTIATTDDAAKAAAFTGAAYTDGKIAKATFAPPSVEGFSVGMRRVRVTPKWDMPLDAMGYETKYLEGEYQGLKPTSDIYMDVYVLADGQDWQNTVVLCSMEVVILYEGLAKQVAAVIADAIGIPASNVFVSGTHNHYSVDTQFDHENVKEYLEWYYPTVAQAAVEAVADLAPATASVGKTETDKLVFKRRYQINDAYGTYISGAGTDPKTLKALWEAGKFQLAEGETEFKVLFAQDEAVDEWLQAIRFDRQGKDDLLLLNFQFHPGTAGSPALGMSRFTELARSVEEANDGIICTMFQGAQGDTTSTCSAVTGTVAGTDYYNWTQYVEVFNDYVTQVLGNMTEAQTGQIHVTGERLQALKKNSETDYWNLPLNAICFGDVAISTFPHELFSSTALTVLEESPYAMTFTLGLTNGGYRYMADQAAWDHSSDHYTVTRFGATGLNREDSFEIRSTLCAEGTAERIAQWHVATLEEMKKLGD